jgi:hypothetical protein
MDYKALLNMRNPMGNTQLNSLDELMFQQWNDHTSGYTGRQGINPDPDAPGHLYDYRGQYKAGVPYQVDPEDNYRLHGDSRFKKQGHGRSIIEHDGQFLDTKTGRRGSLQELLSR